MKTRYKIIVIGVCAYFGVFFSPVIGSNVYCDFISQEMCTSRITGVNLPPFNMIPLGLPNDDECFFENTEGMMMPCHIQTGHFEWPFPSQVIEHSENCDEICQDSEPENENYNIPIGTEIGKTGKFPLSLDDGSIVDVEYSVAGGYVLSMKENKEFESILITMEAIYDGRLKISIPRYIADAKAVNGVDDIPFIILNNGEEVIHSELSSSEYTRTILVDFDKNTTQIEIIGADHV